LPLQVKSGLALAAALGPILERDLAAPWLQKAYLYDASLKGGAVVETEATVEELRREARWGARGGWCVWIGGSSMEPMPQIADLEEDLQPGTRIQVPDVSENWDPISRWMETFRWTWQISEHINICEMRTGLAGIRHAVRSRVSHGRRILMIGDSLVTIGAYSKGRSSSAPLLHLCRRMAAYVLFYRITVVWRWIQTYRNHADGPSRGGPLGVMPKEDMEDRAKQRVRVPTRSVPRSIAMRVYRFLHLCSGHRRPGDLADWLTAQAAE